MNTISSPYILLRDKGNIRSVSNPFFLENIRNNDLHQKNRLLDSKIAGFLVNNDGPQFSWVSSAICDVLGGMQGLEWGATFGAPFAPPFGSFVGGVTVGTICSLGASGLLYPTEPGTNNPQIADLVPLVDISEDFNIFTNQLTSPGSIHNDLLNIIGSYSASYLGGSTINVNNYIDKLYPIAINYIQRKLKPTLRNRKYFMPIEQFKSKAANFYQAIVDEDFSLVLSFVQSNISKNEFLSNFLVGYIEAMYSIKTKESFWSYNNELLEVIRRNDFLNELDKVKIKLLISVGYHSYCFWKDKSIVTRPSFKF